MTLDSAAVAVAVAVAAALVQLMPWPARWATVVLSASMDWQCVMAYTSLSYMTSRVEYAGRSMEKKPASNSRQSPRTATIKRGICVLQVWAMGRYMSARPAAFGKPEILKSCVKSAACVGRRDRPL
jgi:hypothetical protein